MTDVDAKSFEEIAESLLAGLGHGYESDLELVQAISTALFAADARGFQRCLDLHLQEGMAKVSDLLKGWEKVRGDV